MPYTNDHLDEVRPLDPYGARAPRPPDALVDEAKEVLARVQNVLLRQPGARAVDVGFRINQSQNAFTPDVAIRLHVENKLTARDIADGYKPITLLDFADLTGVIQDPLPEKPPKGKTAEPPKEPVKLYHPKDTKKQRGFFLDVIEARYLPSSGGATQVSRAKLNQELDKRELEDLVRSRAHPLVGGVSIGNDLGNAGTLGAVVWDRTDGSPCLLSNWHVLAGSLSTVVGSPCYQPALLDGGRPDEDLVGRLKRGLFDRHGDAALAEIVSSRPYGTGEILGLWVPVADTVEPKLGMPVRKWGRTTGFTHGFIDGVAFTVNLDYGRAGVRRFDGQVHIASRFKGEELSAEGDSGAVWVTKYVPTDPNLAPGHEQATAALVGFDATGGSKPAQDAAKRDARQAAGSAGAAGKEPAGSAGGEDASGADAETGGAEGGESENGQGATSRVYFAVALNFAGDAPGSHSGEFAVASPIPELADRLEFSFRPVFFPRSRYVVKAPAAPPPAPPSLGGTTRDEPAVRPAGGQGDPGGGPQPTRRIPP